MRADHKDNEASASETSENKAVENETGPEEKPIEPEAPNAPYDDFAIGPEEDDAILGPEIPTIPKATRTQETKETPHTFTELKRLKQDNADLQKQIKAERDPEALADLQERLVKNLAEMNKIILDEKTRIQNSKSNRNYGLVLISLSTNEAIDPSDLEEAKAKNTPILFRRQDEVKNYNYWVVKSNDRNMETVVGSSLSRRSEFAMYSEIEPGKWGLTPFDFAPQNDSDKLQKSLDKKGLHDLNFPPWNNLRGAKKPLPNFDIKRQHGEVFNILERHNPYLKDKPSPQEIWILQELAQLKIIADNSNKLLPAEKFKVQETVSATRQSEILSAETEYVGGPRGDHFSVNNPPKLDRSATLKLIVDPVVDKFRDFRRGASSRNLLSEKSPADKEKPKKSGPR